MVGRSGDFTALLVKKTPFTADEKRRPRRLGGRESLGFGLSAAPEVNAGAATASTRFSSTCRSEAEERAFVVVYPFRRLGRPPTTVPSSSGSLSGGTSSRAVDRFRRRPCR